MQLKQIMTREVQGIDGRESTQHAAELMAHRGVGALPVFGDGRPIGIVTDRDITIRAVAAGAHTGKTPVASIMTGDPVIVSEETDTNDAAAMMEQRHIRRLLVQDSEGRITGVVSLDDLASRLSDANLAIEVLKEVSYAVTEKAQPEAGVG